MLYHLLYRALPYYVNTLIRTINNRAFIETLSICEGSGAISRKVQRSHSKLQTVTFGDGKLWEY